MIKCDFNEKIQKVDWKKTNFKQSKDWSIEKWVNIRDALIIAKNIFLGKSDNCGLCKHYYKKTRGINYCLSCPLHDEGHNCCLEYDQFLKLKNLYLIDMIDAAQALIDRIKECQEPIKKTKKKKKVKK